MGRKERKGRKERETAMKKIMMGIGLVAVAVLGCSRENLKNKDDETLPSHRHGMKSLTQRRRDAENVPQSAS